MNDRYERRLSVPKHVALVSLGVRLALARVCACICFQHRFASAELSLFCWRDRKAVYVAKAVIQRGEELKKLRRVNCKHTWTGLVNAGTCLV